MNRPDESQLPDDAAQALETILNLGAEAVLRTLEALAPPPTATTIALLYGPDDQDMLDPMAIAVGTTDDREAAAGQPTAAARFADAWNPSLFSAGDLDIVDGLREVPEFQDAERRLVASLNELGCKEPARWTLNRVARQARQLVEPRLSGDLVVFVEDPGFADDLIENVHFTTPAELAGRLHKQGILPRDLMEATS